MGPVRIAVADLDRAIGFYQDALIGLRLHRRDGSEAAMGAEEEDVLVLQAEQGSTASRARGRPLPLLSALPHA